MTPTWLTPRIAPLILNVRTMPESHGGDKMDGSNIDGTLATIDAERGIDP